MNHLTPQFNGNLRTHCTEGRVAYWQQQLKHLNVKIQEAKSKNVVITDRSSRPEVFCKKGVLRNFAKFTGKHLCQSLFFNKVAGLRPATLLKRDSGTGVFL